MSKDYTPLNSFIQVRKIGFNFNHLHTCILLNFLGLSYIIRTVCVYINIIQNIPIKHECYDIKLKLYMNPNTLR